MFKGWYESYPRWFWKVLSITVKFSWLFVLLAVYAIDPSGGAFDGVPYGVKP